MNWREVWRLLRELTGERAYEQYLEAHRGEPVMSEKEFWRHRTDEHKPNTCC